MGPKLYFINKFLFALFFPALIKIETQVPRNPRNGYVPHHLVNVIPGWVGINFRAFDLSPGLLFFTNLDGVQIVSQASQGRGKGRLTDNTCGGVAIGVKTVKFCMKVTPTANCLCTNQACVDVCLLLKCLLLIIAIVHLHWRLYN